MQAGESISFISTPDELAVVEAQSEEEQEAVWDSFGALMEGILYRYPDAFRSVEQPEESGTVTISEGSFRLPFDDGSYLHVVVYHHSDEGGYIDLGLSIVEHDGDGKSLGGYLYEMGDGAIRFARHTERFNDEMDDGQKDAMRQEHFSILSYYERVAEMYANLFSDDEELRKIAQDSLRQLEEEASLSLTERELGFGWGAPRLMDVVKLQRIADSLSPFSVPSR